MILSTGRRGALAAAAGAVAALALAAPAASAADDCPNAFVRAQQNGSHLPECRAYELVTPASKAGSEITGTLAADPTGGGIGFASLQAFAGSPSSMNNYYFARRADDGWHTTALMFPTLRRFPAIPDEPDLVFQSADGKTTMLVTSYPLDDREPLDGYGQDLYRRLPDGAWQWVSEPARVPTTSTQNVRLLAASLDGQRVLMATRRALAPEIVDETRDLAYFRDGMRATVVATVDEAGAPVALTGTLAADESVRRIVYIAGGRMLMRDLGTPNARKAALGADGTTECTSTPVISRLGTDGRWLQFQCVTPLTPDSPASGLKTYLRNLDTGEITYVSGSIRAHTADLSAIWEVEDDTLYIRRGMTREHRSARGAWPSEAGGASYTSPDGEFAVAVSQTLPESLPAGGGPGVPQVYLYSARDASITCISCPEDGSRPVGQSSFGPVWGSEVPTVSRATRVSSPLRSDGRRVFFSSERALVPEDTNGRWDAYVWVDGRVHLLSSGSSRYDSAWVNASADGRDAFIVTVDALVPQDLDTAYDAYSVRVDGGFAVTPPAAQCETDCQGPPPESGAIRAPGTATAEGPGDIDDTAVPSTAKVFAVPSVGAAAKRALVAGKAGAVRVRVSQAGRVRAVLTARIGGRSVTVASASRTASAGGSVQLQVKLSKRARIALRRNGQLRVTLKVTWSQQKGAQSQSFVLRAGRGGR